MHSVPPSHHCSGVWKNTTYSINRIQPNNLWSIKIQGKFLCNIGHYEIFSSQRRPAHQADALLMPRHMVSFNASLSASSQSFWLQGWGSLWIKAFADEVSLAQVPSSRSTRSRLKSSRNVSLRNFCKTGKVSCKPLGSSSGKKCTGKRNVRENVSNRQRLRTKCCLMQNKIRSQKIVLLWIKEGFWLMALVNQLP